jgi:hypothetical protein
MFFYTATFKVKVEEADFKECKRRVEEHEIRVRKKPKEAILDHIEGRQRAECGWDFEDAKDKLKNEKFQFFLIPNISLEIPGFASYVALVTVFMFIIIAFSIQTTLKLFKFYVNLEEVVRCISIGLIPLLIFSVASTLYIRTKEPRFYTFEKINKWFTNFTIFFCTLISLPLTIVNFFFKRWALETYLNSFIVVGISVVLVILILIFVTFGQYGLGVISIGWGR